MILEDENDLFAAPEGSIILNQVNALGYGAVGIMAKVRKQWPAMF